MASLTESEAVFTARLKRLGIESLQLLFNGKEGWNTTCQPLLLHRRGLRGRRRHGIPSKGPDALAGQRGPH